MDKEKIKNFINYIFNKNDIKLSNKEIDDIYLYICNLKNWNNRINLTAIKEDKEIIIKHFLDSIIIKDEVVGNRVLDIGSGAGFPRYSIKNN